MFTNQPLTYMDIKKNKIRKTVDGPIRNKERTKRKLLDTIGKILQTDGYSGFTITNMAKVSGCNAKLFYLYFQTLENLIDVYITEKDFWGRLSALQLLSERGKSKNLVDLLTGRLELYYTFLLKNPDLQGLLVWELSGKVKLLNSFSAAKRAYFDLLFDLPLKSKKSKFQLHALLDILISGLTSMCIYGSRETPFLGFCFTNAEDRARLYSKVAQSLEDLED